MSNHKFFYHKNRKSHQAYQIHTVSCETYFI
uniref:Uncharacterized protein n=1 Tax=Anguilla anguilla TaxID=7936 RepID=A0A0E9RI51_ANGAN